MDGLRDFVSAFCVACVFTGGMGILCPKGSMSRSVRYALSLFMLCAVIGGAVGFKGFELSLPDSPAVSVNFGEQNIAAAEETFRAALERAGINFSGIEVCTDKTENGGISIIEVIVYSSEDYERIAEVIGGDSYSVRVKNE